MQEYISLNELITEKSNLSNDEANLLIEEEIDINDDMQHLYQIMGIKDENKAYIMHVGFADKLPKILLKEFDFKGYEIKIVSYVFNKFNLTESKKSKLFKMIGLLMCKNDAPLLSIDIEYNIKLDDESTNIIDLISTKENIKETNGEFIVLLRKKNDNNVKVLHKFVKYPGNNNLIEKLHKFLWHKEIIYMY